jgi:hypothetical protein
LQQEHQTSHEKDRRNEKSFDVIGQVGRGLNLAFLGGMTVIVARIHQEVPGLFVVNIVVRRRHRIIPSAIFPVAAICDSIGRWFHAAATSCNTTRMKMVHPAKDVVGRVRAAPRCRLEQK